MGDLGRCITVQRTEPYSRQGTLDFFSGEFPLRVLKTRLCSIGLDGSVRIIGRVTASAPQRSVGAHAWVRPSERCSADSAQPRETRASSLSAVSCAKMLTVCRR